MLGTQLFAVICIGSNGPSVSPWQSTFMSQRAEVFLKARCIENLTQGFFTHIAKHCPVL